LQLLVDRREIVGQLDDRAVVELDVDVRRDRGRVLDQRGRQTSLEAVVDGCLQLGLDPGSQLEEIRIVGIRDVVVPSSSRTICRPAPT
jgi:hypothetical protein